MTPFVEGLVTIALAIVGLGVVSVLVSKNATTPSLVQNLASGFGNDVGVAESPVTGAMPTFNLGYATPTNGYASGFGG